MMTPSQLKEHEFKPVGRNAYKMEDVDDFFAEVAANYTKMFHENGELVRRVGLLADRLEKFKKEEEEIKSAVVSAQRAADIIVRDAKNSVADAEAEAEAVLKAAKSEAELIKSDAEKQAIADSELLLSMTRDKAQEIIKKAKEEAQEILLKANSSAKDTMGAATRTMTSESLLYDMLKKEVAEFKSNILNQYKTHIELISKLPDLAEAEAQKQAAEEKNESQEVQMLSEAEESDTAEAVEEKQDDDDFSISSYEETYNIKDDSSSEIEFITEEGEDEDADAISISDGFSLDANDFAEEKKEILTKEADGLSADDFEEFEEDEYDGSSERKAALKYFSDENKDDLMAVDEEMLTQDGELVVKTDLPLSIFDDTDSLEFVDDFDGMEEVQEDVSGFSFSDVQRNTSARKRPSNRVTVDSSYLDFLAAEAEADDRKSSAQEIAIIEDVGEDDEDEEYPEATQRKGFFRRK